MPGKIDTGHPGLLSRSPPARSPACDAPLHNPELLWVANVPAAILRQGLISYRKNIRISFAFRDEYG